MKSISFCRHFMKSFVNRCHHSQSGVYAYARVTKLSHHPCRSAKGPREFERDHTVTIKNLRKRAVLGIQMTTTTTTTTATTTAATTTMTTVTICAHTHRNGAPGDINPTIMSG
ncbi:uncharacterized protein LOC105207388 isoform X1 [Solenopsis invicta]|uniref:uncharacterized protein LOC105207388 isoform X1 n=1 Tax=Solenopsis invicta TaxID=13686 RepID=UPI00193E371A|nr:uncharacterized protein LOC105207388 isoform X1 [Solenopsis invicta]